jgi:hypothetical protein
MIKCIDPTKSTSFHKSQTMPEKISQVHKVLARYAHQNNLIPSFSIVRLKLEVFDFFQLERITGLPNNITETLSNPLRLLINTSIMISKILLT